MSNQHDGPSAGQEMEVVESGGALPMVDVGVAVALAKAEIDQQISTAHAFPRSIKRALDNIVSLATLDLPTAKECIYALPRSGKSIRGPSIRLAEIVASQWGNCRIAARVVSVDRLEKFVEAEGIYHDLETNMATTARVRRRIVDSKGRLYNDDMIIVTGNAACSIAKRNAILGGVPRGIWGRAWASVEGTIVGDIKTLTERRDGALKEFAFFGVTPEQIFKALGVEGVDDIGLDMMPDLIGMFSALKSGESTVEELFPKEPPPGGNVAPLKTTAAKLDALAGGKSKTPPHDPVTGEITSDKVDEKAATTSTQKPATEKPKASTPDREPVVDKEKADAKPGNKAPPANDDAGQPQGSGKAGDAEKGGAGPADEPAGDGQRPDQGEGADQAQEEGDGAAGAADAGTGGEPSAEDRARMEMEAEILQIAQTKAAGGARRLKLWLGQLDDDDFAIAERLKKQIATYLAAGEKLEWPKRG